MLFNNLVKDDKGNYLKLGWESISGATVLEELHAMVGSVFSSVAWENCDFRFW